MLATSYDSLWKIGAVDIYGQTINRLGDLLTDKKCVMVVNIATLDHDAPSNFAGLAELYSASIEQVPISRAETSTPPTMTCNFQCCVLVEGSWTTVPTNWPPVPEA